VNSTLKKQRSTQFEMECRRKHVLERLQEGPKSIQDLFGDTEWSYSQAIITIRKMVQDHEIYQTGKNGREVIYAIREGDEFSYPDFEKLSQHISQGDTARIVGLHLLENDGFKIDIRFPNGDEVEALLVS
jgi:hypothetical protein